MVFFPLFVLLALCLAPWQVTFPGGGVRLPASTLALGIGAVAVGILRLVSHGPLGIRWWAGLPVAGLTLGLLGTPAGGLGAGVKEVAQYAEIFVLSAGLFAVLAATGRQKELFGALAGMHGLALLSFPFSGEITGLSLIKHGMILAITLPFWLDALAVRGWVVLVPLVVFEAVLLGLHANHAGVLLVWCGVAVLFLFVTWHRDGAPGCGRRTLAVATALAMLCALALTLVPPGREPSPWDAVRYRYDRNHVRRFFVEAKAALAAPGTLPFGGGPGRYRETINQLKLRNPQTIHPEDMRVLPDGNSHYLVVLVENGLLGLLALAGIFFYGFYRLLSAGGNRCDEPQPGRALILCSCFGVVAAGFFALSLSRGIGILCGGILGLAVRPLSRDEEDGAVALFWRPIRGMAAPGAILMAGMGLGIAGALANMRFPDNEISWCNRQITGRLTDFSEGGLEVVPVADAFSGEEVAGQIRVEAEAYTDIEFPFVQAADPSASNAMCLMIADAAGKGVGRATYRVNVPVAGRYLFHARVWWRDGCGNSIAFETGDATAVLASDTYGRWHLLTSPRVLDLKEGVQTFRLANLEDGVKVDFWGIRLSRARR